ncbi:hypothetical protein [Hyalangium versicolor]|uniref:hypothetical protein n=1 Tax=Hyalangium versicolor TaxID=2861190 RepID=UPI001CCE709B|nr:hypothetical protein [Hyalangium versicolor]
MIRFRKPLRLPAVLRAKGRPELRVLERTYASDPLGYDSGMKVFAFNSAIYGHSSVKAALRKAQHDKCAFCESKISHIAYGDVEHFRPKAGWRQAEKGPLHRPGYYWLAYDWGNLFLACAICNQQFKKNLFPLRTPSRRATNHLQRVSQEEPLLLDPAADDPETFISFRKEVPYAVGGNARGRATIKHLGLQRAALAERRRDHLEKLEALKVIAGQTGPKAVHARSLLKRLRGDYEPYASMARAFLR